MRGPYFNRFLSIVTASSGKSIFLFGPRQTGKSSLLRHQLPDALTYNLLDATLYRRLAADPSLIRREVLALDPAPTTVVIDEVQRIPELLNEVHLMIEEHGTRFILTGSSARALRKKGVNLLAGRARSRHLHPFVTCELGESFSLPRALNHGLIPSLYFSDAIDEDLADYVGTYLREEIAAEGLIRNLQGFSRFLDVAGLCNGQIINYSNLASDVELKRSTVVDYFQILRDTLLGCDLPAWQETKNRKPIKKSKFYFFDIGVVRHLVRAGVIEPKSPLFGQFFEHFIWHELQSYCDYHPPTSLHYWRSTTHFEVDFILDGKIAIEVKGKDSISSKDLKGLRAFQKEAVMERSICVALVERPLKIDDIDVLPYREFLDILWAQKLL